ncbi:hypothetical protein [Persephonella sp.]|uniref:hypothetical protein n=1 Tax=Persephonella sp. TaxID=2060922 RepID=UPI0025D92007|nr:hypothetical protein [Persephonella sp.]
MMEVGSWLWKISYMLHVISNAAFFGISLVFTFGNSNLLNETTVKKYLKISFMFVMITGATGILLLSILTMTGMDDLTSNPIGQSALFMILGYVVVLFVISLALIYKGGEERIYKKLFGIMFFSYLFVYIVRVYLTT